MSRYQGSTPNVSHHQPLASVLTVRYIQSFADGNKRIGRLTCNVPLLRAGLPPMSFIGVNKADYHAGMVYFYESGDTSLIADVIAEGYEAIAPSYMTAVSTIRMPRGVELREQARIEEIVSGIISDALREQVPPDVETRVREVFRHLNEEDRGIILENVLDTLASLNEANCIA